VDFGILWLSEPVKPRRDCSPRHKYKIVNGSVTSSPVEEQLYSYQLEAES
jgi:hypothetical protein